MFIIISLVVSFITPQSTLIASEISSELGESTESKYDLSEVSSELKVQFAQNSEESEIKQKLVDQIDLSEIDSELKQKALEVINPTQPEQQLKETIEANVEQGSLESNQETQVIQTKIITNNVGDSSTPSSLLTDNQLKSDENQTDYINQNRVSAGSGETKLVFDNPKASRLSASKGEQPIYYTLNSSGQISSQSIKQPRSTSENIITVVDGEIINSTNAIIRTNGGYKNSFYIYSSLDNLKNDVDGIPISGGGFDGTLLETVEEDGVYYHRIKISGYEGYVLSGNVQIIPEELISSRSYYTVEDNQWVYYSAIDALTSTEYDRIVLDDAPSSAKSSVKYYSDDDVNFYTTPILTSAVPTNAALRYNSYYMNLPMRSASSYTASNYKAYLNAKGKSSSTYFNETSAFTKAQELENVNSLLLFSMANHESAYGLSTYAKACYNFFGRGAIDSDPDKACQSYSFPTATDGILAQALFLQNGYFDILDWRYSGTNVGNKQNGLNVKYASDVDWGKKISNHAYMIDQYLGSKDENRYPIISVSGNSLVYADSNLTQKLASIGDNGSFSSYNLRQQTGTNDTVNVVAIAQTEDAYQVYVPTAVKNSSSVDCSYTSSMRGSYPNYNGRTKLAVGINAANYACDYVSFENNAYWISKKNTKPINNVEVPESQVEITVPYSNGQVQYKFYLNEADKTIKYANGYDRLGNLIYIYEYQNGTTYGNHGSKIRTRYFIENDEIRTAYRYNSLGQVTNIYSYYPNAKYGSQGSKLRYSFLMNPSTSDILYATGYDVNRQLISIFEYRPGTKFGGQGSHIQYKFIINPSTNDIKYGFGYNLSNQISSVFEYPVGIKYNSHIGKTKYKFTVDPSTQTIRYAYRYNTDGKIVNAYEYEPGTKYLNHGSKIRFKFVINPQTNRLESAYRYNSANQIIVEYKYSPNTVYRQGHGSRISSRIYY